MRLEVGRVDGRVVVVPLDQQRRSLHDAVKQHLRSGAGSKRPGEIIFLDNGELNGEGSGREVGNSGMQ